MFCPIDSVYPAQYEQRLTLKNGKEIFVRPIIQTDEAPIVDLLNKLSADSIYLRFYSPSIRCRKIFSTSLRMSTTPAISRWSPSSGRRAATP